MITTAEYESAKETIRQYELQLQIAQMQLDNSDDWEESEPCSVCGDIDGMANPCCPNYDPLHYKNCGYG